MLEPDLAEPVRPRWLAFTGPAVEAGVRAVFGFPLHVGVVRLGSLNLYRRPTRAAQRRPASDTLVMADVAAQAVLILPANAPPGSLATALEADADFQYVVHQSSGMGAAQLDISVAEALIRLRAYAFGNGRALAAVAQDVVARTLRFNVEGGDKDSLS